MKQVLEERGNNTATLKADDMRTILYHYEFASEKTMIEHLLEGGRPKRYFSTQIPL